MQCRIMFRVFTESAVFIVETYHFTDWHTFCESLECDRIRKILKKAQNIIIIIIMFCTFFRIFCIIIIECFTAFDVLKIFC